LFQDTLCVSCHYHEWLLALLRVLSLPAFVCVCVALFLTLRLYRSPRHTERARRYVELEAKGALQAAVDSVAFTALVLFPLMLKGPIALFLYCVGLGVAYYHAGLRPLAFLVRVIQHVLHDTIYPYLFFLFVGAWIDIPLHLPVLDTLVAVVIGSLTCDLTSSSVNLLVPGLESLHSS
jgi:hypothetical protein